MISNKWRREEPGWYIHDRLGSVVFETAQSIQTQVVGPKRGWWWYGKKEVRGPFRTATDAIQEAEGS